MDTSLRPGVEVLLADRPELVRGRALGLVTHDAARDRGGRRTADLFHAHENVRLVALFGPEHGLGGDSAAGEPIGPSVDLATGLPVFSLYGDATRPTATMLRDVDTLVVDVQDIGARVYTYMATLIEVLRAGAAHGVPVVVLDRPNPINGTDVEGNVLDPRFASFVGPAPIAMRHGMTIGELALFANTELCIHANLIVVAMAGWRRDRWLDQTGLPWVDPSPNMRSLATAALYPGTVLFEGTNLSVGRGTDRPFAWVGAPWVDADAWIARLHAADLPGVRFHPLHLTPTAAAFADERCEGVMVEIADRARVRPMALGVAMLATVRALHPDLIAFDAHFDRLAGTDAIRQALLAGEPAPRIADTWREARDRFLTIRGEYLLY